MPQELQVVQCFSCENFQVQIVKKVPKWECKVCGEKQSVIKVYYKGSGKDCRLQVQFLNKQRHERAINVPKSNNEEISFAESEEFDVSSIPNDSYPSKWCEFLEKDELSENGDLICAKTHKKIKLADENSLFQLLDDSLSDYSKNCSLSKDKYEFSESTYSDNKEIKEKLHSDNFCEKQDMVRNNINLIDSKWTEFFSDDLDER